MVGVCGIPKMPYTDKEKKNNYMKKWRDKKRGQRVRAISILGFFKNRIVTREFHVTKAEWFVYNDGESVRLDVEADVRNKKDLDDS